MKKGTTVNEETFDQQNDENRSLVHTVHSVGPPSLVPVIEPNVGAIVEEHELHVARGGNERGVPEDGRGALAAEGRRHLVRSQQPRREMCGATTQSQKKLRDKYEHTGKECAELSHLVTNKKILLVAKFRNNFHSSCE